MGETTARRVVGVVGGGPLCLLLGRESRRKGLPFDVVSLDPGARAEIVTRPAEPLRGAALGALNGSALPTEHAGDFAKEISIQAARSGSGEIRLYPPAETIQPGLTVVPAVLEPAVAKAAEEVARHALETMPGAGVFGIELVVDRSGALLIREVVPGPPLSGLWTIEACRTSLFEQHLRAISGLPLGETFLLYSAVTVPIEGAPGLSGPFRWEGLDAARAIPGVHVHLYEESVTSPGKRLGHVTLTDVNDAAYRDILIHRADQVRRMIVQKETKPWAT